MSSQDQRRNLNPSPEARFAMFHWHNRYAEQRGGSMDFYDALTPREQQYCKDAVLSIVRAFQLHGRAKAAKAEAGPTP